MASKKTRGRRKKLRAAGKLSLARQLRCFFVVVLLDSSFHMPRHAHAGKHITYPLYYVFLSNDVCFIFVFTDLGAKGYAFLRCTNGGTVPYFCIVQGLHRTSVKHAYTYTVRRTVSRITHIRCTPCWVETSFYMHV